MADNLLFPFSGRVIVDSNGTPLSGAKLEVFDAGTTDQKNVYTDAALTSAAANPVVTDANGVVPVRYLGTGSWKTTFKDSADATLANYDTWDSIPGALDTSSFLTGTVAPSRASLSKTANYTTVSGDLGKQINCDATGGDFTITMLSAAAAGDAADQVIKNTGETGIVTVSKGGDDIILMPLDAVEIRSDGASWHAAAHYKNTDNLVTVAYAASVAVDVIHPSGANYQTTLTGDMTEDNPTSLRPGTFWTRTLIQDATGGNEVTFGSNFNTEPFVDIAANAVTVLGFHARSASSIDAWNLSGRETSWDYVAYNEQSSGTAGGGLTSGSWVTLTLNVADYDRFGLGSPSSNQVVFPPGVWEFDWTCQFFNTALSQSRLYNATGSAVLEVGLNALPGSDTVTSHGWARATLSAATTLRLEGRVQSTKATNGQGPAASYGTERYTRFRARKIASL